MPRVHSTVRGTVGLGHPDYHVGSDPIIYSVQGAPSGGILPTGQGLAATQAAIVVRRNAAVAGPVIYVTPDGGTTWTALANTVLSVGASTAAAGTTTANAGVLPAATGNLYRTSAADDITGVRVHADDRVTGRTLYVANGVSNKILNVYPPTGGTINGAAANAAYPSVSGRGLVLVCLDGAANTWAGF